MTTATSIDSRCKSPAELQQCFFSWRSIQPYSHEVACLTADAHPSAQSYPTTVNIGQESIDLIKTINSGNWRRLVKLLQKSGDNLLNTEVCQGAFEALRQDKITVNNFASLLIFSAGARSFRLAEKTTVDDVLGRGGKLNPLFEERIDFFSFEQKKQLLFQLKGIPESERQFTLWECHKDHIDPSSSLMLNILHNPTLPFFRFSRSSNNTESILIPSFELIQKVTDIYFGDSTLKLIPRFGIATAADFFGSYRNGRAIIGLPMPELTWVENAHAMKMSPIGAVLHDFYHAFSFAMIKNKVKDGVMARSLKLISNAIDLCNNTALSQPHKPNLDRLFPCKIAGMVLPVDRETIKRMDEIHCRFYENDIDRTPPKESRATVIDDPDRLIRFQLKYLTQTSLTDSARARANSFIAKVLLNDMAIAPQTWIALGVRVHDSYIAHLQSSNDITPAKPADDKQAARDEQFLFRL